MKGCIWRANIVTMTHDALSADGVVGSNDVRPNATRTDFLDGWHMITVTTLATAHVSRPWALRI